jgi:hypothetical protein
MLVLEPDNVVMDVGEGLAMDEALTAIGARDVGAKDDGVMVVGEEVAMYVLDEVEPDDGAIDVGGELPIDEGIPLIGSRVVGATVDVVMDVGERLAVDEALTTIGAEDVGAAEDVGVVVGLLTFPPVFVQNVVVPVGS